MSKRTVIFQKYGKIITREVDELFYFSILNNQSEFVVVAACRGLRKIILEKVNNKDYLFIVDDISSNVGYPKQIDDFLKNSKVTAKMLYHAILDSTNQLFPKMRLIDIYYNYEWLSEVI